VPRTYAPALLLALLTPAATAAEPDGFLHTDGGVRFPIGLYDTPKDDAAWKDLAGSGVNLVRCRGAADLDRCRAAGVSGWVSLPVQEGWNESLRGLVLAVRDHPALAVWEGPDEVVWNFTAYSGLAKTAGIARDDWTSQKPNAVAYARREADKVLPRMCAAIGEVRKLDPRGRPFWINEAGESDLGYVRRYLDAVDVTGCDYYPVKPGRSDLPSIGKVTDRWRMAGRGKPVWMVLQGFSWHKVRPERYPEPAYPTFAETRFMAWDAVAHGARGVLYWGCEFIDRPEFRTSVYAMTSELAALGPLLAAPPLPPTAPGPTVRLVESDVEGKTRRGVRLAARSSGDQWMIALINEDDTRHLGVEVRGLDALDGRDLDLLYGDETVRIARGELTTRMQPFETKVFATGRRWESPRRAGRDFR
jgi:hypothetical protein